MTLTLVDQDLAWFKISLEVHDHFAFSAKQRKSMYLVCGEALVYLNSCCWSHLMLQ